MTHDEHVEQAHALLQSFVHLILARLAQNWADRGLSLPQIRLLLVLFHTGPSTIGQIADHLHIGQSAASLLVDRLVQAHLAERADDPSDRRRAIVRLTEEGEASLGRQRAGQQRMHAFLGSLDDNLAMLIDTFTAMLALTDREGFFGEDSPERIPLIDRSTNSSAPPAGDELRPRGWMPATVVAGLLLVLTLSALDATIVGTALPTIVGALHGFEQYSWVVTAYLLTSTTVVPIIGKLSDQFGRKGFLLTGIALFLLGSALLESPKR